MHEWATITKHSQFFYMLFNQKTNHLHTDIPHLIETYSCQYIFVCYKTQHTILNSTHRTFNSVRSITLNAILFYIWEALVEKVSVWEQKTLKQTCQVYVKILVFYLQMIWSLSNTDVVFSGILWQFINCWGHIPLQWMYILMGQDCEERDSIYNEPVCRCCPWSGLQLNTLPTHSVSLNFRRLY